MIQKTPITVAHGDGIGPEIMAASLHIIQEAGAALEIETIDVGEKVYLSGNSAGIEPSSWESLRPINLAVLGAGLMAWTGPCRLLIVCTDIALLLARALGDA